ncbi:ATP-binding protein [Sphingosinicella sp. CPCC 101087]|uniref:hybrid sensor histidine kinase/response regulator n=1 Tax=Sphingosinicella sp. CPCC 101087 TaxID=2497754 RepID=UPI001FB15D9C|nr:ATP-binding protein [Sphingosinicella sp. CPCC 101087]
MSPGGTSERALLLAPRGRDAAVACGILAEAGIDAQACPSIPVLLEAMDEGVGFVLVTEEAVATADATPLVAWIARQEEWSDLPFVLLTTGGGGLERNPAASRYLGLLGNVTFLERPFHPTTLVSLARSALRGRRRQYDARARLKELHESSERYRSLFESIDAGFCIIEMVFDADGKATDYRFVEINPAFVRQTGMADAPGRRMRELVPGHEQHWFDIYGRVALTGEAIRFENSAKALGRWYDVHAFRLGDPADRRVAVLFTDISARRAMEEELRELTASLEQRILTATAEREAALAQLHEAQKLETLGQLTGGVAHDFNNLLTPITGVLDLLNRRYGKDDARAKRLIGGALESAERARTLVQRLLGFARRQALQTRPVDPETLLDGMRDLIASSIGATIELQLRLDQNLPPVLADPHQLELAVLNLCVNARDAMPSGGLLTVAAEVQALGPGEVPQVTPGLYIRLSVIDTGAGMDEETLSRAVEPFYSTKEVGKGTGLGLSMVHGLASQLGGGFRLTSTPGEGTRVDLWLPVASEQAVRFRVAPSDEPVRNMRPLSILLVDDEQLVRAATADMLRELGHSVTEARGGLDALTKLPDLDIDIVVTDYTMPQMNGAELAQRIRESRPELPLLLITGYAGPAEGAPDLPRLDKPFRRADLAAAIERVVNPHSNVVPLRRG